jgi:drug/metabolite transporter (DMT)-like permease
LPTFDLAHGAICGFGSRDPRDFRGSEGEVDLVPLRHGGVCGYRHRQQRSVSGLSYVGLQTVSAGLAGLIVSSNPVFTAIFAALLLGEALSWRKIAGLLLGLTGVTLIVWHRISIGSDSWQGILLLLVSLTSIVLGTLMFKLLAPKGNLWIGNGIQNLAGAFVLFPFALTFSAVTDVVPSARLLVAFTFLVLGGSVLAYLLWFHLLKVCGATAASAYHFLMPPLGILFAWIILGEHVGANDLLGVLPVALGFIW